MLSWFRSTAVVAALGLTACREEARWLRIERSDPTASGESASTIALNQALTVYFSEPIDPFTVTPESVRVRDERGHPVRGELETGTRWVRFVPRPPVTPGLADGSFVPGRTYRLEFAGMPTSFALRSRAGRPLERGFALRVRIPEDPAEMDLPTPFLPVDAGVDPLRLDVVSAGLPRVAASAGELTLRFNYPVLPSSVRPEAFHLWRIVASASEPEELRSVRAVVIAEPLPGSRHPGAAVRLDFGTAARLEPTDVLYLGLADGDDALRDYRGRAIEPLSVPLPVKVDPGDRIRMRDLDLSEIRLERDPDTVLGFEARDGRIFARAFVEAGSGWAGSLVVRGTTVITPGMAFDRGDGTELAAAGPGLEFSDVIVAEGAELQLHARGTGLVLRSCGDVRIRGRVVLDRTSRRLPWRSGDLLPVDALLRESGAALVVGGDLIIEAGGEIVSNGPEGQCPLVIIAGGDVRIDGAVPLGCGFALRPTGRIEGTAEAAVRWRTELTRGVPADVTLEAAAWTGWLPLPSHAGTIDLTVVDPRDGVEAWLQVAPPHSIVAGRPQIEEQFVTPPMRLPLREPLAVPHGAFVRIMVRGTVRSDATPSIAGFAIHER